MSEVDLQSSKFNDRKNASVDENFSISSQK